MFWTKMFYILKLILILMTIWDGLFLLLFRQGLYCISVNCMDNAEAQFTTALRVSAFCCHSSNTVINIFSILLSQSCPPLVSDMSALVFQLTTHQELWTYIVTNLASVYIREGNRHQEVRPRLDHNTVTQLVLLLQLFISLMNYELTVTISSYWLLHIYLLCWLVVLHVVILFTAIKLN